MFRVNCLHGVQARMVAKARLIYWAVLAVVLFAWFNAALAAEPRPGLVVEAFMQYRHLSDLARGCPFKCDSGPEPNSDYLAPFGMTITAGRRRAWEIDLSTGAKRIDGECCESGSEFGVRYYPKRGR